MGNEQGKQSTNGTGEPGSDDLGHVAPELREAIEGGSNASAPDAVTGKLSSEGTGNPDRATSAGEVGSMGGVGATPPNHDNRPPGGVSPLSGSKRD